MTKTDIMNIISALMEQEKADGCMGCAFFDREDWEDPCRMCKRSCKDYWRAKDETD